MAQVVNAQVWPAGGLSRLVPVPVEGVGVDLNLGVGDRGKTSASGAGPTWVARCSARVGSRWGGMATSRTPAADLGVPTETCPVMRTTPRRTCTTPVARSRSARRSSAISLNRPGFGGGS